MAGNRTKIARKAREDVQRRIVRWVSAQKGTQQAVCKYLKLSVTQLHTLVNEGSERCSLEYLLDVWERCGGEYALLLNHSDREMLLTESEPLRGHPVDPPPTNGRR